jgi:hypothetical protein
MITELLNNESIKHQVFVRPGGRFYDFEINGSHDFTIPISMDLMILRFRDQRIS